MEYCPNCGKQISETANFCRRCGSNLKVEEEITRAVPAKSKRTSGKGFHKTSWLEKHPNIVTIPVAILCIIPLISLFACYYLLKEKSWIGKHPNILAILCIMPWTCLIACGYVLNQKDRSLAWLLLFLFTLLVFPLTSIAAWVIVMLPEKFLLTEEQVRAGLWVEREGVFLNLKKGEEFLTTFPRSMTTKATIRQEAQKYV